MNRASQMAGHLIRRLGQHSNALFQEQMKALGHDLTSVQFAALDALEHAPGMDQAQLARTISCDRATIGAVIKLLLRKELITRHPDPDDRRAFKLWLSDQGTVTLAQLAPKVLALQDDILAALTKRERAQFIALLVKALPPKD